MIFSKFSLKTQHSCKLKLSTSCKKQNKTISLLKIGNKTAERDFEMD